VPPTSQLGRLNNGAPLRVRHHDRKVPETAVHFFQADEPPMTDYRERITFEPGKRGGKPCVRGLRITVYDVLSYLAAGMSYEEVLRDFPNLEREDILACLAFAAERERATRAAA